MVSRMCSSKVLLPVIYIGKSFEGSAHTFINTHFSSLDAHVICPAVVPWKWVMLNHSQAADAKTCVLHILDIRLVKSRDCNYIPCAFCITPRAWILSRKNSEKIKKMAIEECFAFGSGNRECDSNRSISLGLESVLQSLYPFSWKETKHTIQSDSVY